MYELPETKKYEKIDLSDLRTDEYEAASGYQDYVAY